MGRARVLASVALAVLVTALLAERLLRAGITFDEPLHLEGIKGVLAMAGRVLAGEGGDYHAIPGDYEYYGIGTLLPAYGLAELLGWLLPWPEIFRWSAALHLLAQASFLVCLWSCWQVVRPRGRAAAALATAGLALLPEFLGHGLMNYKDMPVAAGVMLCLQATLAVQRAPGPRALAGLGASVVWLATQKLAAATLVLPCLLVVLVLVARRRSWPLWRAFLAIAAASLLLTYLATPQAWVAPFDYLADSIRRMANFQWKSCMRAAGRCYGIADADWSPITYLAQWTLAKVPLAYLAAWAAALVLALRRPRLDALLPFAVVTLFLASIAASGSTLYDALRHVLFLLPMLMVATAAAGLFQARWVRLAALLVMAWLAGENLRFYPYSYAWFTPLTAPAAAAGDYDSDYWGYSLREAAALAPPDAVLEGKPRLLVEALARARPPAAGGPRYFLYILRWNAAPPEGCAPAGEVARATLLGQRIAMSRIAACGEAP